MDLKHLRYFVTVAECGSINKAAQCLYISQPHLSHIVKELEDSAGALLFLRTKQGVRLTAEGERFLRHSRNILGEWRALEALSSNPRQPEEQLRCSMTKFSHVMQSFIEACRSCETPGAFRYRLNEGTTMEVLEEVAGGQADIGVVHIEQSAVPRYRRLLDEKGLDYTRLAVMEPHIVLSERHPLLAQPPVTLDALREYGFVRYIGQYEDFLCNLSVGGVEYDLSLSPRIVSVYGRATLHQLISATDFYTIGIQDFPDQQAIYGTISLPIPRCDTRLEFGYVLPRGAPSPGPVERFVSSLRLQLA